MTCNNVINYTQAFRATTCKYVYQEKVHCFALGVTTIDNVFTCLIALNQLLAYFVTTCCQFQIWKHCKCCKMVNIASWCLAFHPHCVSVDPRPVAKALRWFRHHHTKAFQIYSASKDLFLLLLGSAIPSKEVVFIGRAFAHRNVWLSVCVLVAWTCRPISAITTGNDQPFALKSQQSFSLFPLSPETRGGRPAPPPYRPALHSLSVAPHSELCHQMPVRMQNKRLLA